MREPGLAGSPSSPTARAFEAGVSISDHGSALFYVIARSGLPDLAVRSVGGELVTRLPDPCQALALAPIAAHAQLRDHADLRLAGPVSVDPERFKRFTKAVGVDVPRSPAPTTSNRHRRSTDQPQPENRI